MHSDIRSTALPTFQWFRHNLKRIDIVFLLLAGLVLWQLDVSFSRLGEDEKQALEMVKLFHERMNAGHFDEMYNDAHPKSQFLGSVASPVGTIYGGGRSNATWPSH